ncbi:MAG TPA: hypothetical protein VKI65_11910 [Gemmataceae bacterium]|nr:hypothetical protein [Gemmataceae bacterium]
MESRDRTLALLVRVLSYEADFMNRIDRVSREFDDALYGASGFIFLTSNFRPPRGSDGV